jgi:hypothetical protein
MRSINVCCAMGGAQNTIAFAPQQSPPYQPTFAGQQAYQSMTQFIPQCPNGRHWGWLTNMMYAGMTALMYPNTALALQCSMTPGAGDPCTSSGYRCSPSTRPPTMLCCR